MVLLQAVRSNALSAGLNDGWTVGAASRMAVVALVEVFIRASEAGPASFTRLPVSHIDLPGRTRCADPLLSLAEPERDLALCRLR